MDKLIDGVNVKINNLQLFEKAFEGLAIRRNLDNNIRVTIDEMHAVVIDEYVSAYKQIYDLLPFPLYAVEEDIKYVTIALAIISTVDKRVNFIIDSGLKIRITETKYIYFSGEKWNIETCKRGTMQWMSQGDIKLEEYKSSIGFDEYTWALKCMLKGESLADYYTIFMPDFIKACRGDGEKVKYHLTHMLELYEVPAEIDIPINSIIDEGSNEQYIVDVFSKGSREIKHGRKSYHFSLSPNGNTEVQTISERIPIIDYRVLKKEWDTEDEIFTSVTQLKESELGGLQSVFEQLITGGVDGFKYKEYRGIIIGGNIVYTVDGKLFICQKDNYIRSKEVANNVEIIATYDKNVYFRKKDRRKHGVTRISVHKLSLINGIIKLCNISFI